MQHQTESENLLLFVHGCMFGRAGEQIVVKYQQEVMATYGRCRKDKMSASDIFRDSRLPMFPLWFCRL